MLHTVLITGANRGIGLEFVKQYLNAGWQVIACCRDPQKAEDLNAIRDERLTIYPLEVTEQAQIESLAKKLDGTPIDLLINNAGIGGAQGVTVGNIDPENLLHVYSVNTIAPVKLADTLLPNLRKSSLKTIANISSRMGSIGDNTSGRSYAYRSSKSALNMIMKSMAIDLKEEAVKVVTLHPGWVKTDLGGDQALITVEESVTGMIGVIAEVNLDNSGAFLNYLGETIEW